MSANRNDVPADYPFLDTYHYLQHTCGRGMMVPSCLGLPSEEQWVHYIHVYTGEAEGPNEAGVADEAFYEHNQDDRPRGTEIRSMSVGDVVVVDGPNGLVPMFCDSMGWVELRGQVKDKLVNVATRKAYGTVSAKDLARAVEVAKMRPATGW